MTQKVFEQIWKQLRAKKATYKDFLERVTIKELRGIKTSRWILIFP